MAGIDVQTAIVISAQTVMSLSTMWCTAAQDVESDIEICIFAGQKVQISVQEVIIDIDFF